MNQTNIFCHCKDNIFKSSNNTLLLLYLISAAVMYYYFTLIRLLIISRIEFRNYYIDKILNSIV